jgi:hypothetical protein
VTAKPFPSRSVRWVHRSHADGLVHRVLAAHRTPYADHAPIYGITECGQHTRLMGHADDPSGTGEFVGVDVVVNCIPCSTGACAEGEKVRAAQKEALFAAAYGMPTKQLLAKLPGDAAAAVKLARDIVRPMFPRKKRFHR